MTSTRGRALERIERLVASGMGDRALRVALAAAIGGHVRFDGYVFLLTDPVTGVGASPLASIPGLSFDRLPELIRARYLTEGNRWRSGPGVVTMQSAPPGGDDWRRMVMGLGGVDVATLALSDSSGSWGLLDLWRIDTPPFGAPELDALREMVPILARGVRRALAETFALTPAAVPDREPVVLMLDDDLRVLEQTGLTDAWLRILNPTEGDATPVPAHAYNVAAQLVARERGIDDCAASARTHLAHGSWVTLRAARAASRIVVTIEAATSGERVDVFARTHGLSPRETEVLSLLVGGADSKQIARTLVLSEHTVHDHVRSILGRTGARTRQVLLARALGGTAI